MTISALSTLSEVRTMGRLPDSTHISDAILQPHLSGAARELMSWLGEDYTSYSGDDKEACKEAEQCISIAYALPVLHTFYTENIPTVQKEIGELEYLFHNVGDVESLAEMWMNRARDRVSHLIDSTGTGGVGWYAI